MGKVISVTDGDNLTLLTADKQQIKVRLNAIDAPEKAQAYGSASKKSLSDLCYGKQATVETFEMDKYGRTIGDVYCDGLSANTEQIRAGMAWVYRKYSDDPELIALEDEAKAQRIGLWDDSKAIAPWDFRHGVKVPVQATQIATTTAKAAFTCGGKRFCKQMISCEEAMFYLNSCGVYRLDRDNDGIPCESICR